MQFEILFVMQLVVCLLVLFLCRRIMQMRQQFDHVVKEVEGYIAFITEEEAGVSTTHAVQQKEESENYQSHHEKKETRSFKDDAQTQLIQAVLGEYFP